MFPDQHSHVAPSREEPRLSAARLSVLCAMAACIGSGLGAAHVVAGFVTLWASNCSSHGGSTLFVVGAGSPWAVGGMAVAVALPISLLIIERNVKSQANRLHLTYWLALLGLLLALAMWVSTLGVLGFSRSCP